MSAKKKAEVENLPPSSDKVIVNGTIPLFSLYTFMVWTGVTSPFHFLPYLGTGRRQLHA